MDRFQSLLIVTFVGTWFPQNMTLVLFLVHFCQIKVGIYWTFGLILKWSTIECDKVQLSTTIQHQLLTSSVLPLSYANTLFWEFSAKKLDLNVREYFFLLPAFLVYLSYLQCVPLLLPMLAVKIGFYFSEKVFLSHEVLVFGLNFGLSIVVVVVYYYMYYHHHLNTTTVILFFFHPFW